MKRGNRKSPPRSQGFRENADLPSREGERPSLSRLQGKGEKRGKRRTLLGEKPQLRVRTVAVLRQRKGKRLGRGGELMSSPTERNIGDGSTAVGLVGEKGVA